MSLQNLSWGTIHPSVFSEATGPLRSTPMTARPHGAMRYQCPVTGSLVLVTDEATLAGLQRRRARIRCVACSEMHFLTQGLLPDGDLILARQNPIGG